MKLANLLFSATLFLVAHSAVAQYDENIVEYKSSTSGGETYSLVKMSRKGSRVKVKYFAAKAADGSLVYQRFLEWSRNKNIIAVSSGTYMTHCEASQALPVGFCVDNGVIVNRQQKSDLGGLAIVYATGGLVVTNINDGNLSVAMNNQNVRLDLRNAYDRETFLRWAQSEGATVFQTHLFVYKNQLKFGANPSTVLAPRRFLAAGKDEEGNIVHYMINLPKEATLKQGSEKAYKILRDDEFIDEVVFMINLDPGCQDVFAVYDSHGNWVKNKNFNGYVPVSNAANLIVYYYE